MKKQLKDLCEHVLTASIYWTKSDEERRPRLKQIRLLARQYLNEAIVNEILDEPSEIDRVIQKYLNTRMIGGTL